MTKSKQNQNLNNWQKVNLAEATTYINRGVPPVYTEDNAGTAVINQKCIRDGQVNFEFTRLTDESARQIPQDKLVKTYDILVNSTGTGTVGRVGQVINLIQRTTVDSHVTIVRPKDEEVDPIYLGIWLKSQQAKLEDLAEGSSNQVELSRNKIATIKVPLPPIRIQQKIADILSSVDEAIQKTDQIIQKTEVLKQGLMRELLTKGIGHKKFQKTKIGEIPEEWEVTPVGKICDCIVPGRNKPKVFNGDIPWITIPNIQDSTIQYNDFTKYVSRQELKNCGNKIIPINSVIMSCVGDFGIATVTDREIAINQQLHAFLPTNGLDQNFLKFALMLQKAFMENLATKTSVPYLNKTSCNSVPLAKPPIEEQLKIAGILSSLEQKILSEKLNIKRLVILKKGLMQDIFNQKVQIN